MNVTPVPEKIVNKKGESKTINKYAITLRQKGFGYIELEGGLKIFAPERDGSNDYTGTPQHAFIEHAPSGGKYSKGQYVFVHHDCYDRPIIVGDTEMLIVYETEILATSDESGNFLETDAIIAKPYRKVNLGLKSDIIDLDTGDIGKSHTVEDDNRSEVIISDFDWAPEGAIVVYSAFSDYEIWYNEKEYNWIHPGDVLFMENEKGKKTLTPGRAKVKPLRPDPANEFNDYKKYMKLFQSNSYEMGLVKESEIDGVEGGDVVLFKKIGDLYLDNHFWLNEQMIHGKVSGSNKIPGLSGKDIRHYKNLHKRKSK